MTSGEVVPPPEILSVHADDFCAALPGWLSLAGDAAPPSDLTYTVAGS